MRNPIPSDEWFIMTNADDYRCRSEMPIATAPNSGGFGTDQNLGTNDS